MAKPRTTRTAPAAKSNPARLMELLAADGRFVIDTFQDSGLISRALWNRAELTDLEGHLRVLADDEEGVEIYRFTHNYTMKWSARFDASAPALMVRATIESAI